MNVYLDLQESHWTKTTVGAVSGSGEARDFEVGGFCKGRGSIKTGGLGDGSPPAGSRGRAPVGGLGDEVPQKLKFVAFCVFLGFERYVFRTLGNEGNIVI